MFLRTVSIVLLGAVSSVVAYLYTIALASLRVPPISTRTQPQHRFAIAIPAHNEESVIAHTVNTMQKLNYPRNLYEIHVVADHCTDQTADAARRAGAVVHERNMGPRGSKGAALQWLFGRILGQEAEFQRYDAVVVFDADTQVDANFLRIMDARLVQGDQVIQGQHRISNPNDGWFPALTWAMFIIDNRYQNLGRSNLNWSAKHMGDSICFRADVLQRLGWGEGLTEDYAFRQQLLLNGIKIRYEPRAIGNGQAAQTWQVARAQRARWLRGTQDSSRRYASELLRESLHTRDSALLDGALQAHLPSYSTLTIIASAIWLVHFLFRLRQRSRLFAAWALVVGSLVLYPFMALIAERAPRKAFAVILSGPVYILWRTWLALVSRREKKQVEWVRTPHKAA